MVILVHWFIPRFVVHEVAMVDRVLEIAPIPGTAFSAQVFRRVGLRVDVIILGKIRWRVRLRAPAAFLPFVSFFVLVDRLPTLVLIVTRIGQLAVELRTPRSPATISWRWHLLTINGNYKDNLFLYPVYPGPFLPKLF